MRRNSADQASVAEAGSVDVFSIDVVHYLWKKKGVNLPIKRRKARNDQDRMEIYVQKTDDCWYWTGARTAEGYGFFKINKKDIRAHRWAYEYLVGPIPDGMVLDHLCHNRDVTCRIGNGKCPHTSCVRPDHLEPKTVGGNITAARFERGVCMSGRHDITLPNALIPNNGGCRECKKESERKWDQARRTAEGFGPGRCRSGKHDVTLPNAMAPNGNGRQRCRECQNERQRLRAKARREAGLYQE